MYPNFYFILKKVFGIDAPTGLSVIQTFGLFLAITFLVAGYILMLDLRKKEKDGIFKPILSTETIGQPPSISDLLVNALIGFIIGAKLLFIAQNWADFVANAQEAVLSTKGSLIGGIIGALVLAALKYREKSTEAKKHAKPKTVQVKTMPHEMVGDIIIVAAISGLVGAKIFALLETPKAFFADPIGQLLSGSGLAIYGGLIGGFLAVFLYVKRKGMNPIRMMDAAVSPLLIGYGIGRMGCQLSGDGDWGIVNAAPNPYSWLPDWMWSSTFPNNVLGQSATTKTADGEVVRSVLLENCEGFYTNQYCYELAQPVYPTSVYETLIMFVLFAVFWFVLRKRIKVAGVLFFLYMIVNGMERFWIETFRVNDTYDWAFGWTQAQIIAALMILFGTLFSIYFTRQHKAGKPVADKFN